MSERVKASIVNVVTEQGHTDSYGILVHAVALLGLDPEALAPESDEERAEWSGHARGLRSALHCLAMHEKKVGPESAALIVDQQIAQAIKSLAQSGAGSDG